MRLGEMIQAWREKNGYSRRKLASIIGIDHVTLARIENNESGGISIANLNLILTWIFQQRP
jgi:transcriptional regulator with XRE-family HTH domain